MHNPTLESALRNIERVSFLAESNRNLSKIQAIHPTTGAIVASEIAHTANRASAIVRSYRAAGYDVRAHNI